MDFCKFRLPRCQFESPLNEALGAILKRNRVSVSIAKSKQIKEIAQASRRIEAEGLPHYLRIQKLRPPSYKGSSIGFGVFLSLESKPIERGSVIAPYSGKLLMVAQNQDGSSDYVFSLFADLILSKEEQARFDHKRAYHPRRLYALEIDAEKVGNFTRFINHSTDHPNVEAKLLRIPANAEGLVPSRGEIFYVAKKKINPGEQLLICYEGDDKSYWGKSKIRPFPMTPKTFIYK